MNNVWYSVYPYPGEKIYSDFLLSSPQIHGQNHAWNVLYEKLLLEGLLTFIFSLFTETILL